MSGFVGIIHGIIGAVGVAVGAGNSFEVEEGGRVGRDKAACFGVVVPMYEVVQTEVFIEVAASVSKAVQLEDIAGVKNFVFNGKTVSRIFLMNHIAPSVIVIFYHARSLFVKDLRNVSGQILYEIEGVFEIMAVNIAAVLLPKRKAYAVPRGIDISNDIGEYVLPVPFFLQKSAVFVVEEECIAVFRGFLNSSAVGVVTEREVVPRGKVRSVPGKNAASVIPRAAKFVVIADEYISGFNKSSAVVVLVIKREVTLLQNY